MVPDIIKVVYLVPVSIIFGNLVPGVIQIGNLIPSKKVRIGNGQNKNYVNKYSNTK